LEIQTPFSIGIVGSFHEGFSGEVKFLVNYGLKKNIEKQERFWKEGAASIRG